MHVYAMNKEVAQRVEANRPCHRQQFDMKRFTQVIVNRCAFLKHTRKRSSSSSQHFSELCSRTNLQARPREQTACKTFT